MFDISWSELLILAIVTLVFVGPKELPVFLRTLGRYAGTVRRHANEFKAQFDAAMREAELDSMRQEVEQMQSSINSEVMRAKSSFGEVASAANVDLPVKVEVPPASAEPAASLAVPPLPATPAEMAAAEPTAAMTKSEP